MKNETICVGYTNQYEFRQADSVYSPKGVSPTLITGMGAGHQINVLVLREVTDERSHDR